SHSGNVNSLGQSSSRRMFRTTKNTIIRMTRTTMAPMRQGQGMLTYQSHKSGIPQVPFRLLKRVYGNHNEEQVLSGPVEGASSCDPPPCHPPQARLYCHDY